MNTEPEAKTMLARKPLLFNLLLMLGYSILFILSFPLLGDNMIGVHWVVLGLHILLLFIFGIVWISNKDSRWLGGQLLLASLLVAIIGHGLCFFNGLLHFNV